MQRGVQLESKHGLVEFVGEYLGGADSYDAASKLEYFYELKVYRTADGRFVIGVACKPRFGGHNQYDAWVCGSAGEVVRRLREYSGKIPGECAVSGDDPVSRRIGKGLRESYEHAVDDLLARLPDLSSLG